MVVQPFCFISGLSHSSLCTSHPPPTRVPKRADFPALMELQSATFEQLLDDFVHVSLLSVGVKDAEIAMSELDAMLQRFEYQYGEHFTTVLSNFIGTAKEAAIDLQILSFHVQDTVDRVMAANNNSLDMIEGAYPKDMRSSLSSFVLWSSSPSDDMILNIFSESMDMLWQTTEILIRKIQVQLKTLEDLEENLVIVRDIIVRDDSEMPGDVVNVLVWGLVHDCGLQVLQYIVEYLQKAPGYISSALHTLHEMSGNIAALRERVAKPGPSGALISLEVHMNSIKRGLATLEASNRKARERERDSRRILV
ncbi:hypothetical protein F5146DRAFT_1139673 [Armillaria mellea]|nr:hypothetical protein F5146DRAFT_1139673 [Armillaria mellea]